MGDADDLDGLLETVESVLGSGPGEPVDLPAFLALLDLDELVDVMHAFYHKHWKQPWFEKRATFHRMLELLVEQKGAFDQVAGYLRTVAMRRAARDPRVSKAYHVRSRIEGNHGLEKRHGEVRWAESKGLSKRKVQVCLVVLGEVSLALTRLQHGFTHDLSRFVHLV